MRISCTFRLLDSRRTHSNCHRCGNNQLSAIGHGAQLASEFCHAGNQVSRKMPLISRRGIAPIAVQFTICLLEADTPRFLVIIDSVPGRLADAGERTKHNDGEWWNLPARQQKKSNGCDGKVELRKNRTSFLLRFHRSRVGGVHIIPPSGVGSAGRPIPPHGQQHHIERIVEAL